MTKEQTMALPYHQRLYMAYSQVQGKPLRGHKISYPSGVIDKKKWYPNREEEQGCCTGIRQPSRSWPNSFWHHCKTAKHCALKYGVELKELKKVLKTGWPTTSFDLADLIFNAQSPPQP